MIVRPKLEIIAQKNNYFAINRLANTAIPFPEAQSIYSLDRELSGVVLLAKDKETRSILRNVFGSNRAMFSFTLVAKTISTLADEIVCDLPIAQHCQRDFMVISNRTGKKSSTKFRKLEVTKYYTTWSAETYFLRRHQIRLHAHEMGIPIFGEDTYDQIPVPFLSDFKRHIKLNRKGTPSSLYPSPCIHLSKIDFPWEDKNVIIQASLAEKWDAMLKIIKKWN
ncbi:MAG: hypothetical protein LBI77_03880 [Puniceicoccales bacterium]|jgi:23S rRNA pseudouridine955/2504/2580 synthase/23S rRNA pseudouridine1911/1915/1917 synthase|nr:hypothetical protein [Puniceicoccales bacterium]